jgi:hypothetical protein
MKLKPKLYRLILQDERVWQHLAICNAYWWECVRIEAELTKRLFS